METEENGISKGSNEENEENGISEGPNEENEDTFPEAQISPEGRTFPELQVNVRRLNFPEVTQENAPENFIPDQTEIEKTVDLNPCESPGENSFDK